MGGIYRGTNNVTVSVAVTVTATSPAPPPPLTRQNKSCYAQLVFCLPCSVLPCTVTPSTLNTSTDTCKSNIQHCNTPLTGICV